MKNKHNNCRVLGDGTQPEDHEHCKKQTPFQTRKQEILNDPQYQSEAMDRAREHATTKARRDGPVRPHGGGAAKRKGE